MRKHKIAIQGKEASFHHLAAKKLFGEYLLIDSCSRFEEVCEKVKNNEVDYGVLAVENLLTGAILGNYHLIDAYDLNIIGEIVLPVDLHLLGVPLATVEDVQTVVSHPVALNQCSDLVNDQSWESLEYSDTAGSAEYVSNLNSKHFAAIANRESADAYGLSIIQEKVQNEPNNHTRFLTLSSKRVRNERANKGCISFRLTDTPGRLAALLTYLAKMQINVTKVQSIPLIQEGSNYAFILEMEWEHTQDVDVLIENLSLRTQSMRVLGIYVKDQQIS